MLMNIVIWTGRGLNSGGLYESGSKVNVAMQHIIENAV